VFYHHILTQLPGAVGGMSYHSYSSQLKTISQGQNQGSPAI